MTMSRSVHEIVWGLIFVSAVGLGALAGVLAMAVRSIGFISKTIAEAIEDVDPKPVEAIRAAGGTRFQILMFAIVPQIIPVFVGNMIFEWDINIRRSTILGLVGAGGLGLLLFRQMAMSNYGGIATVILADARADRVRRSGLPLCTPSRHLISRCPPSPRPSCGTGRTVGRSATGHGRRRHAPARGASRHGARFRYPQSLYKYGAVLGTLALIAFSLDYLNIPLDRLPGMLGRMGEMLARRYFPPNVGHILNADYLHSVVETLQMSYLATVLGIARRSRWPGSPPTT